MNGAHLSRAAAKKIVSPKRERLESALRKSMEASDKALDELRRRLGEEVHARLRLQYFQAVPRK